ncbi:hypothetical protein [Clostridium sp. C2-6-12]|uniref:hypothetical protein n=1 Tax=Clostridium sp. C2-6-12 TaxID=2698832 RepID=UPI001FABC7A7|nr:hypothetical protein [Clostridium sp. C2-6-12]
MFEKLEDRRAKIDRLNKLNMLVGLFFSDVGFNLLKLIAAGDTKINLLNLDFNDIKSCTSKFSAYDHDINFELIDYPKLKQLIIGSREILSTLIANENILEHETFTDLLMALMHLRDEILFIQHKIELSHDDCIHLKGDLIRVYKTLTVQWIKYLSHLKQFYPFQYNSAIKFNPFTLNI